MDKNSTIDTDAAAILDEAERIRRGESVDRRPSGDHSPERLPDGPTTGEAGVSSLPPASPPVSGPSEEARQLGRLCVTLTDLAYVRAFGPAAAMGEPLRTEAVAAWAAAIHHYLPMVQALGPLGALAAIYGIHTYTVYEAHEKQQWTLAQSGSSADGEDPAKPLS